MDRFQSHGRNIYIMSYRDILWHARCIFTDLAPLGWVSHRVAMSRCVFVCAIGCIFFRSLIGPEITWSFPGLSLVNPPPIAANYNLFQPIPAYSSLFQSIPSYSSLLQHIPAYSSQFRPIRAYSSLFQPISTYSSPFQPITADSSPLKPIKA